MSRLPRHRAVVALGETGLMAVDGSKCDNWPLWGRWGLLRPDGISCGSSNSAGAILGVIKANDNGG